MVYGPPLYPPPPPPPPPKRNTPLIVIACVLGGVFWATVFASVMDDDDTETKRETVSITAPATDVETEDPTEDPTSDAALGDDFTRIIVDTVWEDMTQEDQDSMCLGIEVFGVEWAADEMRGSGDDPDIDWDLAAEIIEEKCDERSTY
jgi:hypothetical protein